MKTTSQHIRSKNKKTLVLLQHAKLKKHVPHTKSLTKQSLRLMLRKYSMVYVKPDRGRFGKGVMRIKAVKLKGKTIYRCQLGVKVIRCQTFAHLYRAILSYTSSQKYIIQKGIDLLKHNQRIFDIRVMVQLSPKNKWETTGIIARIASPNRVVTNFHSNGDPLPLKPLLVPYFSLRERKRFIRKLQALGITTARHMQSFYPKIKEIGIDVGIDAQHLKPWMIEVNTRPDPFIFAELNDKRIFRKIYRYAKAYGKYR